MVAGLAFQVFTLALFILLCADFALRTYSNSHSHSNSHFHSTTTTHSRSHTSLTPMETDLKPHTSRADWRFTTFLLALSISTLAIFIRSVYRVIELSQGWQGALMKNERLFIVLEGVMVLLAVLVLNVGHPGWCFGEGRGTGMKGRAGEKEEGTEREREKGEERGEDGHVKQVVDLEASARKQCVSICV